MVGTAPFDRFSRLYMQLGPHASDSARARARLGRFLWDIHNEVPSPSFNFLTTVANSIHRELGVEVEYKYASYDVPGFLAKCELRDFLDAITLVYQVVAGSQWTKGNASDYLGFIGRVFTEENLSYRVDARGVVHFRVDQEYESNVASAIAVLEDRRFAAAKSEFEHAREDMNKPTPDAIDATRALFAAAESVFKILTASNASLDAGEVKKTLGPFVDRCMSGRDTIAKGAAATLAVGFADWVNACHPYRHGHNQPDAPAPPLELAIAFMSIGAGYVRWLATLDATRGKQ